MIYRFNNLICIKCCGPIAIIKNSPACFSRLVCSSVLRLTFCRLTNFEFNSCNVLRFDCLAHHLIKKGILRLYSLFYRNLQGGVQNQHCHPVTLTVSIFRGTSLRYFSLTKQLLEIWKYPPSPHPSSKCWLHP